MGLIKVPQSQYKYLTLLAMMYVTFMVAGTTVAYKMIQLGPFVATSASLIFPATFTLGGVISEVYGYVLAKRLVWQAMFCGILFAALVNLIVLLPGADGWTGEAAFQQILGNSLRFALAGTVGSLLGSMVNVYIISRWKVLVKGKYFALRSLGASTIGEFILVLITTFLAFVHTVPTPMLIKIFLFAYFSKVVYSLLLVWPAALITVILKKLEQIDIYDNYHTITPEQQ